MNGAALSHREANDNAAVGGGFLFHLDVVEAAGVPQGDKVAVNFGFIIDVALLHRDKGPQKILVYPALAAKLHGFNNIGTRGSSLAFLNAILRSIISGWRGGVLRRLRNVFK